MTQSLTPLVTAISLEKLAYDSLKEAILEFRLKPGDNLVENDLARQLGISKTPVRDALLRLEKEGFILKIPYKGYHVTPITRESIIHMFEIRAVLEGLAARLAALNMTGEDIHLAAELLKKHAQIIAAGEIKQASEVNRQFHDFIIQSSRNGHLGSILNNLDDHIQRYRILSNYQIGRLEKSVDEHQAILTALQMHQPDAAENAARAHIVSVMGDLEDQNFEELITRATAN